MFVFANILFKFLIFYPHFPTFYQQNLYFILFFYNASLGYVWIGKARFGCRHCVGRPWTWPPDALLRNLDFGLLPNGALTV